MSTTRINASSDAYGQGVSAANNGLTVTHCPYTKGSVEAENWEAGHNARKEAMIAELEAPATSPADDQVTESDEDDGDEETDDDDEDPDNG